MISDSCIIGTSSYRLYEKQLVLESLAPSLLMVILSVPVSLLAEFVVPEAQPSWAKDCLFRTDGLCPPLNRASHPAHTCRFLIVGDSGALGRGSDLNNRVSYAKSIYRRIRARLQIFSTGKRFGNDLIQYAR